MIKLNLNYDGLRALADINAQRAALFNSIKAALLFPVIMLDILGPTQAAKAAAGDPSLMTGAAGVPTLTVDQVKAYLQSDRAARHGVKWAVPADNPALTTTSSRVVEFFAENVRELDLGYQVLFDDVPGMLNSSDDHFELIGASMGFTWEQMAPGGAIKPRRQITESKTNVSYLEFGDGLSILDTWFQFSKYYHIADAVNEFLSTHYDKKASLHYSLITSQGAGINIAFTTDDQTTFNAAVADILRKCEAKGYALGSNVTVDILVNPEKSGRILAMLDARRGSPMIAFGTAKQPIAFTVRNVVITTKVSAVDTGYYVVLPGRKLKRADWKALTIESKREPSVAAEDWYGRAQYNAIAGDSDQIRRVLFA